LTDLIFNLARSTSSLQIMRSLITFAFAVSFIFAPALRVSAQTSVADIHRGFERPPDDAKIMMRWWWFGPAVTKPELEREMRVMKDAGIGGFEVQPVYPLLPDDPTIGIKNLPFLSDEHIDALRFVASKSRELGLRMDLTLGSGWPFGGATVPVSDAAGMLRTERIKIEPNTRRVLLPSVTAGEKLIAVFLARAQGQSVAEDSLQELRDIKDGAVALPENLNETNEVIFFISSRTGMQVKRAAVGAEGYVLNHLDRGAVERYLKSVGERLMTAFDSRPPYAVFCDSLEVYNQDWTDDFLEEFKWHRGYDLKPYLPALVADIGAKTADVRHDWAETLTELLNERFFQTTHDWSKRNRTLFRAQAYGVPPATISSNADVDLSEGEGSDWKILRAARWASSANHLYGRQITSSETWTWLHSPVFRASPLDMKAEADLHFLQGINQLIGHGFPYTAEGVEYPGWRFYAAAALDEKNPWWIAMPDVALYLQRMSYLLRQGQPANDVALYLPNSDAWAHSSAGHVHLIDTLRDLIGANIVGRTLEAGYDLDFFDDEALKRVGRIEGNSLQLGANKYRVVILPNVERIPVETLRKFAEFARGGGTLIATRRLPERAPGLQTSEAEQKEIRDTIQDLFQSTNARAHFVADEYSELASVLNKELRPDVSFSPSAPDIGFIHRHTSDAEIYFLANTSNAPQRVNAAFRVEGMKAQWWNPLNGQSSTANVSTQDGGSTVALELAPYESRVIVFSNNLPAASSDVNRRAGVSAPPVESIDLSGDWRVTFGRSSAPVLMNQLHSWTDDEATRYFSGVAVYEREFNAPIDLLRSGVPLRLDFGEGKPRPPQPLKAGMQAWLDAPVKEAAVVYINEQRVGSVWCPPYSIDVTKFLRAGANRIRIEVGNLAINYMAGRRLPDYRLLNLRYGERFQPQDMDKVKPVSAGLLGTIRLIVADEPNHLTR
jgi:hypothetical protein